MLAIFLDVHNEILEITREFEVMQRKVRRFESAEDMEDKDSHTRAIAGCIHGIYNGMEKILKDLINHIDGVLPTGDRQSDRNKTESRPNAIDGTLDAHNA